MTTATSRRRLVSTAAWALPATCLAAAAPAASASTPAGSSGGGDLQSMTQTGLNRNGSVQQNAVHANPRAYSWPAPFDGQTSFVEIEILSTGASASSKPFSLISSAAQPELSDWQPVTLTNTRVVLRWPTAVSGMGFNTGNMHWYWNGTPAQGSITVTGRITGTTTANFDEGTMSGPA